MKRPSRQELRRGQEQFQTFPARTEQSDRTLDGMRRVRNLLGVWAGDLLRADEMARQYARKLRLSKSA